MLSLIRQIAQSIVKAVSIVTIFLISIPLILLVIFWCIGFLMETIAFFPDWLKIVLVPTFMFVLLRYFKAII